MRCKLLLLLITAIVLYPPHLKANSDNEPDTLLRNKYRDQVYVSAFGEGFVYSIGYRNIIKENSKGLYAQKVGFTYFIGYYMLNYSLEKEIGTSNHHLIYGLGFSGFLFYEKSYSDPDIGYHKYNNRKTHLKIDPYLFIAYSYYNPLKRITYRFDLFYPKYNYDGVYFPWAGFTLGYRFNSKLYLNRITASEKYSTRQYTCALGVENEIGLGNSFFEHIGKTSSLTSTTNIYLKYYQKVFST